MSGCSLFVRSLWLSLLAVSCLCNAAPLQWTSANNAVCTAAGLLDTSYGSFAAWFKAGDFDEGTQTWQNSGNPGLGGVDWSKSGGATLSKSSSGILPGGNSYVNLPSNNILTQTLLGGSSSGFTVCGVLRVNSITGSNTRAAILSVSGSMGVYAGTDASGNIQQFAYASHSGTGSVSAGTASISWTDWNIICTVHYRGGMTPGPSSPTNKVYAFIGGTGSGTTISPTASSSSTTTSSATTLAVSQSSSISMDVAEVIGYNTALSVADIDRVASYLSRKFGVTWQTVAGSGTSGALTRGAWASSSALAGGGTLIEITGDTLFPGDREHSSTFDDGKLLSTLRVTVGKAPLPQGCTDEAVRLGQQALVGRNNFDQPLEDLQIPCNRITLSLPEATCVVWQHQGASCAPGGSGTFSGCSGTLQCSLPPVAGLDHAGDIHIHWQGIRTTLSNWMTFQKPQILSVFPSQGSLEGGNTVTIKGSNFGGKEVWNDSVAGEFTVAIQLKAAVEFQTTSSQHPFTATAVHHVSDNELVVKAPPLSAKSKQMVHQERKTVYANVVVKGPGGTSVIGTDSARYVYQNVPLHYGCDASVSRDTEGKSACSKCCIGLCVQDSEGTPTKARLPTCTAKCRKFCSA